MRVDCDSWIWWLVSRVRSCADKLGGRWERESTVTAKLYDDVGHGKDVGLRMLLPAAGIMAARALPPQKNRGRMAKKRSTEREYSKPCVMQRYGVALCSFNLLVPKVMCRMQGVGSVLPFSGQPDSGMERS